MKHRYGLLILFLIIGLLAGSLVAHLLSSIKAIEFLTKALTLSWSPKANLDFLMYEFDIRVKISLLSILGMIGAIWIYRRTR